MTHLEKLIALCEDRREDAWDMYRGEFESAMDTVIQLAEKHQEQQAKEQKIAKRDCYWIQCLQGCGYDNWEGYDDARDMMDDKYGDDW